MIKLDNVYTKLGGAWVLRGVSLEIERGEVLAVVGPSGAGKSMLLKHIIGLLAPDHGSIYVDGQSVSGAAYAELARLRRRMGYVFQDAALIDWLNVRENLRLVLDDAEVAADPAAAERRIREALARVNLPEAALEKRPNELSGGMRKRAGVARAIVHDPDIILYDEPTTGLDPQNVAAINQVILRIRNQMAATSLVVTHDMASVARIADRVVLIAGGEVIFHGTVGEFFTSGNPFVSAFTGGEPGAHAGALPWQPMLAAATR